MFISSCILMPHSFNKHHHHHLTLLPLHSFQSAKYRRKKNLRNWVFFLNFLFLIWFSLCLLLFILLLAAAASHIICSGGSPSNQSVHTTHRIYMAWVKSLRLLCTSRLEALFSTNYQRIVKPNGKQIFSCKFKCWMPKNEFEIN